MPLRIPELLILFVVALLIFGPKKLPEMGNAIGKSLTAFRRGWSEISGNNAEDSELMERRAELKRLELEALDREIAAKKASLSAGELSAPQTVVAEETPGTYTDTYTYTPSETYEEASENASVEKFAVPTYDTPEVTVPDSVPATTYTDTTPVAQVEELANEETHVHKPQPNGDKAEQTGSAR